MGWMIRGSISDTGKRFLSSPKYADGLRGPPSLFNFYLTAEIKNVWNKASASALRRAQGQRYLHLTANTLSALQRRTRNFCLNVWAKFRFFVMLKYAVYEQ